MERVIKDLQQGNSSGKRKKMLASPVNWETGEKENIQANQEKHQNIKTENLEQYHLKIKMKVILNIK